MLSKLRLALYLYYGIRKKVEKGQVTTSGTLPETTRGDRDRQPKQFLRLLKPGTSGDKTSAVRTLTDSVSFKCKFTPGVSSLTDMHCRLSKGIEKTTFTERHFPYSDFRLTLSRFEEQAIELLNDTLVTSLIRLVLRSKSHYIGHVSENHSAMLRQLKV